MLGSKLRELRSILEITQAEIGKVLGMQQDVVSKIENGKRVLTSFEMFKLSKEYDIPIGFFFGEVNLKNLLGIRFRATEELTEQDKKKIRILKEIAQKQYDIEDVLQIGHDKILRKYLFPTVNYQEISNIASSERAILGFDENEPIRDLGAILRSQGIKILEPILEYAINGMFFTLDESRFLIVINADNSPAVRNFSLAHEFGHYLFNRGDAFNSISRNIEKWDNLDEEETLISQFAAEFLMPDGSLENSIVSDEAIALYMHNYKVSRNALIYRLDNLGRLSTEQKQYYLKSFKPINALRKLRRIGIESDEVIYNDRSQDIKRLDKTLRAKRKLLRIPELLSFDYKKYVLEAYERGLITYRKAADYLFMAVDELKEIISEREETYEI